MEIGAKENHVRKAQEQVTTSVYRPAMMRLLEYLVSEP